MKIFYSVKPLELSTLQAVSLLGLEVVLRRGQAPHGLSTILKPRLICGGRSCYLYLLGVSCALHLALGSRGNSAPLLLPSQCAHCFWPCALGGSRRSIPPSALHVWDPHELTSVFLRLAFLLIRPSPSVATNFALLTTPQPHPLTHLSFLLSFFSTFSFFSLPCHLPRFLSSPRLFHAK